MIDYNDGAVVLSGNDAFSPERTFGCGQAFRFGENEGCCEGIAFGKRLRVRSEGDRTILSCSREDFESVWKDYFDLGRDYSAINIDRDDAFLAKAAAFGRGIRILRQQPWEALCSFIISQCNNIPRIKGIIAKLCGLYGEPADGGFAFPTPERIAALPDDGLDAIRAGYRAPYILGAARAVASGKLDLPALTALPTDDARRVLLSVNGVGKKVADCTLLYGLGHTDAFPVDVWMKRALSEIYPGGFDEKRYGGDAGIIQQYIFYYARETKLNV